MSSLKRLLNLVIMAVAILLAAVILLGIRQQRLEHDSEQIISNSEALLFRFATVREEITSGLIGRNWPLVAKKDEELQQLQSRLNRLFEDPLLPGQYKLAMAGKIDLGRLAATARGLSTAQDQVKSAQQLQEELRATGEHLTQFDRIIVSQFKTRLVRFQGLFITILGLIIALVSLSLVLVYRRSVLPLISLDDQIQSGQAGQLTIPGAGPELARLIHELNQRPAESGREAELNQALREQEEQLSTLINSSTNVVNGMINVAQLLEDSLDDRELTQEHRQLLERLSKDGERLSGLLRQSLI